MRPSDSKLTPTFTLRSEPFAMGMTCSPGSSSTENAGTTARGRFCSAPFSSANATSTGAEISGRASRACGCGAARARTKFGDIIVGAHPKRRWREGQRLILRLVHGIDAVSLRIVAMQRGARGWSIRRQIQLEIRLVVLARAAVAECALSLRSPLSGLQETVSAIAPGGSSRCAASRGR